MSGRDLRESLLERRARETYERECPNADVPFHELPAYGRTLYLDAAARAIERELLAGAAEKSED